MKLFWMDMYHQVALIHKGRVLYRKKFRTDFFHTLHRIRQYGLEKPWL